MRKQIGDLVIDVYPPESSKFKSPLLLAHGLWSGSWCWYEWATHFSNLGWECWAVNLRGRVEEKSAEIRSDITLQDWVRDLKRLIHAAPFPPVLLGHSLGGLAALEAIAEEKISALILLSSLPPSEIKMAMPRALRLFRLKYLPLIFLCRPFCPEEKDLCRSWLASLTKNRLPDIVKRMTPESSSLISDFFDRRIHVDPTRIRCPVLIVGGSEDKVVPMAPLHEMAQWLGVELKEYPNHGHWMMGEGGGEVIVREIHRWLVQKLGEEILVTKSSQQS